MHSAVSRIFNPQTPGLPNASKCSGDDSLLTANEILKNDDEEQIGIPEKSLMHIGGNLFGGDLYMKVSDDAMGQIHYMENYQFREQFPSFSAFLIETEPEAI